MCVWYAGSGRASTTWSGSLKVEYVRMQSDLLLILISIHKLLGKKLLKNTKVYVICGLF